jgi:hypothetical protein
MVQDDARRFALAARMRAFGTKTLKEFVLMQREYSLKGSAEKIECPTLVCANVADAIVGGQALEDGTQRMARGTRCLAQDGHLCHSLAEKTIDDLLHSYGIPTSGNCAIQKVPTEQTSF